MCLSQMKFNVTSFQRKCGKNVPTEYFTIIGWLLALLSGLSEHCTCWVPLYYELSSTMTSLLLYFQGFCAKRLGRYSTKRNDPNENACSNLSPWLHLGHLSAQRAVLHVKAYGKGSSEDKAGFVEEAVVRRELSDNFCFHNPNYDSVKGGSDWAQKSLAEHAKDPRDYIYTQQVQCSFMRIEEPILYVFPLPCTQEFESARTHDELWNSAQLQLTRDGKIHGFMRMYWAKKILEWTESPEEALAVAIRLNDHYSLDGCDANGYVGCMWSIVGIHDMGILITTARLNSSPCPFLLGHNFRSWFTIFIMSF